MLLQCFCDAHPELPSLSDKFQSLFHEDGMSSGSSTKEGGISSGFTDGGKGGATARAASNGKRHPHRLHHKNLTDNSSGGMGSPVSSPPNSDANGGAASTMNQPVGGGVGGGMHRRRGSWVESLTSMLSSHEVDSSGYASDEESESHYDLDMRAQRQRQQRRRRRRLRQCKVENLDVCLLGPLRWVGGGCACWEGLCICLHEMICSYRALHGIWPLRLFCRPTSHVITMPTRLPAGTPSSLPPL